jgi:DNA-binding Lrp family transcriptional regulator
VNALVQPGVDAIDKTAADVRLLSYLQEKGGVLVSSQGALARALGWSKWWCHVVLHDLAAAGLVKLTTAKTASVVRLIPITAESLAER